MSLPVSHEPYSDKACLASPNSFAPLHLGHAALTQLPQSLASGPFLYLISIAAVVLYGRPQLVTKSSFRSQCLDTGHGGTGSVSRGAEACKVGALL